MEVMDDHQGAIRSLYMEKLCFHSCSYHKKSAGYILCHRSSIDSDVYVFLNFVGAYSHYPCHLMAPIVITVNASIHFIDPVYELITADGALVKFLQHTLWT